MAKRKVIFSFDAMCEWETALVINNLFSKETQMINGKCNQRNKKFLWWTNFCLWFIKMFSM